jgi:2'-5' RNA ligase
MTNRRPADARIERLRLFIAIELPDPWKQALEALRRDMESELAKNASTRGIRVRWVRPEGVHLTLKFLGEVATDRLEAIDRALLSAVPAAPGFELAIGRAGSFSDRRAPRVIWTGIVETQQQRQGQLLRLVEQIETWLAAAGFPRERRGFTPHLTLARLPEDLNPAQREAVAGVTNAFATPPAPPFKVERVSLMRSFLGPGGARYERLASYPDQPLQAGPDRL